MHGASRPSIGMVAAKARVSIKTVSRVLNNASCVTPATREHVLRVIHRLNYSPSAAARRLSGHRSRLIGVPFDGAYASYVTEVQSGAMRICNAENYQLVMHACDSRAPTLADDIALFVQRVRVDAVILSPPLSDMPDVMDALLQEETPFVRIAPAKRYKAALSIFTDDYESACSMTQHLASLGHVRIGFIGASPAACGGEHRYFGYCQGLRKRGLALDPALAIDGCNGFESAVEHAKALLERPAERRPTAIFAGNDEIAAGVLRAAHERGLAVPEELSVAGFEDAPIASQVWPRLTTVRHPLQSMAARAAQMLMAELRGEVEEEREQFAPSALVLRQSTAPASAPEGPLLSSTLL
jgi:LacI family transcriptional regulator